MQTFREYLLAEANKGDNPEITIQKQEKDIPAEKNDVSDTKNTDSIDGTTSS